MVVLLIQQGADANILDGEGTWTLTDLTMRLIVSRYRTEKQFFQAPYWGFRGQHWQFNACTLFLNPPVSVECWIIFPGSACIHLAAQFGHTAIVAYLVAKRMSDVNFQVGNRIAKAEFRKTFVIPKIFIESVQWFASVKRAKKLE